MAVPSGLDDRGLPLSLQITGRALDEAVVLRVARSFEKAREIDFDSPLLRMNAA